MNEASVASHSCTPYHNSAGFDLRQYHSGDNKMNNTFVILTQLQCLNNNIDNYYKEGTLL